MQTFSEISWHCDQCIWFLQEKDECTIPSTVHIDLHVGILWYDLMFTSKANIQIYNTYYQFILE